MKVYALHPTVVMIPGCSIAKFIRKKSQESLNYFWRDTPLLRNDLPECSVLLDAGEGHRHHMG
jgi:hypothetical protein